ncbi:MAG: TetR/AcrR family transcriptional regulator [Bacteroidota bacterium]
MEAVLTRKERERQARRDAMLDAARAVFAEKGYARATLDEIAHRAEFGKGTLYNYFDGGKEGILLAIIDQLFDDLLRLVDQSFGASDDSSSFRDAMHAFLLASMRYFEEQRDLFLILMKEAHRMLLSDDADKAQYILRQQHRVIDALIPHLERAMEAGEMRTFSSESIAHTLIGNLNGIQMHVCTHDGASDRLTPEQAADFLTTVLMDGLTPRPSASASNGTR